MILNILIATTVDRRPMFEDLMKRLNDEINLYNLQEYVSIIYNEDNKEISIGKKRQLLLEQATADYIVFFDSDDLPKPNYISGILHALDVYKPDCVGIEIDMTTNGDNPQKCCHSKRYPEWKENVDGYDYVRNVTHFNPVKRELALQVGFKDLRFGEDKDYSDRLTPLCQTEVFISGPVFEYRFSNHIPHKEKYGFK